MPDITPQQVQPVVVQINGVPFAVVAYVEPKHLPAGLDLTMGKPGEIAPVGMVNIRPGCLVVALDPQLTAMLLADVQRQHAKRDKSKPAVPGLQS